MAGVSLMDELLRRGWLEAIPAQPESSRGRYSPTAGGIAALTGRGVIVPNLRAGKAIAFSCLDWTERRWHLGGALGRAIVNAAAEAGCIRRVPDSRVVELTGSLEGWLE